METVLGEDDAQPLRAFDHRIGQHADLRGRELFAKAQFEEFVAGQGQFFAGHQLGVEKVVEGLHVVECGGATGRVKRSGSWTVPSIISLP